MTSHRCSEVEGELTAKVFVFKWSGNSKAPLTKGPYNLLKSENFLLNTTGPDPTARLMLAALDPQRRDFIVFTLIIIILQVIAYIQTSK
jgi:hypothetical protein